MEGGVWGVVIVACAFMIQVISFGTESTIGVYNVAFLDYFRGQTVGVSLIGSINFGVYLASGPIVSLLMTKFCYRKIALGGSFLVVGGLLGMRIYPYIPTMCFFFGVLTGFGNCCVYIPSHVLSGLYYDKYRCLATGISNSGSGLGGAVMPVLVGLLIEIFTWKGSLVILAGINLHLFLFCALLRMPPALTPSCRHVVEMEMEVLNPGASNRQDVIVLSSPSFSDTKTETETTTNYESFVTKPSPSTIFSTPPTDDECPSIKFVIEDFDDFDIVEEDNNSFIKSFGFEKNKLGVTSTTTIDTESFKTRSTSSQGFVVESPNLSDLRPSSLMLFTDNRVLLKSQSFIQPSGGDRRWGDAQRRRQQQQQQLFYCDNTTSSLQLQPATAVMGWRGSCLISKVREEKPQPQVVVDRHCSSNETQVMRQQDNVDQRLLRLRGGLVVPKSSRHVFIFTSYAFDVYFLSNMMWNAGYTVMQSFAPEFMIERGVSPIQAAWLSGAFGFGSFIGGIFGACCGNVRRVNRKLLYAIANVAMGFTILLFPNFNHIVFYAATLITSGLAFGVILGLLVIVLSDLVGPQSLGNGIGYLMLSNGIGAFVGPPVASLLRERTGGFEASIVMAGCLCILGGLVMLLMPCGSYLDSCSTTTSSKCNHSNLCSCGGNSNSSNSEDKCVITQV